MGPRRGTEEEIRANEKRGNKSRAEGKRRRKGRKQEKLEREKGKEATEAGRKKVRRQKRGAIEK